MCEVSGVVLFSSHSSSPRTMTPVLILLAVATVVRAAIDSSGCGEPALDTDVAHAGDLEVRRRAAGYLVDAGTPWRPWPCKSRACLCTLGEDVVFVDTLGQLAGTRYAYIIAGNASGVSDAVAPTRLTYTDDAQRVACGADGNSLVVVTDFIVVYLTRTTSTASFAVNATDETTISPFQSLTVSLGTTIGSLVNVDTGRGTLAVALYNSGNSIAVFTRTTNTSYRQSGSAAAVLVVRVIATQSALRARSFTAVGLPASAGGVTALVYAQTTVTLDASIPTTNADMVVLYVHSDMDAAQSPATLGARAAAHPTTLELYGSSTSSRSGANVYWFRRRERWPHYRNDTSAEALVRSDGIRRMVFTDVPDSGTKRMRAYVISVPVSGVRMRVPFRDTAPLVWQCVFAFVNATVTSIASAGGPDVYPPLACQTAMPFMVGATEQTTPLDNVLEAFHPRPITTRAPSNATQIDVFAVNLRVGPLRFGRSECGSATANDLIHQTVLVSSARAPTGEYGISEWRPQVPADFFSESRSEYPDREAWMPETETWNTSAALQRHSYEIVTGLLAPAYAPRIKCTDATDYNEDGDAAGALSYAIVRHADSTPSGLVILGTQWGLVRYRLVPAGAPVRVEGSTTLDATVDVVASASVIGAATQRGAVLRTLRSEWAALGNNSLHVRFSGAAPVVGAFHVDLVRVGDIRPQNQSFQVALGSVDACRRGAHTLAIDLRALPWLTDGLYTTRLLETYWATNTGPSLQAFVNVTTSATEYAAVAYDSEFTVDVGMQFLSVRTHTDADLTGIDSAVPSSGLDATGGAWWEGLQDGAPLPAGANATLIARSLRLTPSGDVLWGVTDTHLVRLVRPFHPQEHGGAGTASTPRWANLSWALPSWCTNGSWDSVALDATEPAYIMACTWDPLGTAGTTPPVGWSFGTTVTGLWVWTTPATVGASGWRSRAISQGAATHVRGAGIGSPRWGRVYLLAVDGGYSEVMHMVGADPYTFGVTRYTPWTDALRTLDSGDSTAPEAVRAQDEWRTSGPRDNCTRANSACTLNPALLYPLPATSYTARSNLAAVQMFDFPDLRVPRQRQELRWSTATDAGSPDGKRAAVFFPRGAVVVCSYEQTDPRNVATQLGVYTNGPCRMTPLDTPVASAGASVNRAASFGEDAILASPTSQFTEAQVIVTPSTAVILAIQDDGFSVRLRTLYVDRDLAVYTLSFTTLATTWPAGRTALVYQSLGLVTFADYEIGFDAVTGTLVAGTERLATVAPIADGVAWQALSPSERSLLQYDARTGVFTTLATRARNITDSAWAAPGTTNITFLACASGSAAQRTAACYSGADGTGVPRRSDVSPSVYATDVYPSNATLAPAYVRAWAGAQDWYATYPPAPAVAVDDTRAPWFHSATRYRRCGTGERPRRYTGAPDVWTCYWDADADVTVPHPRVSATAVSCGGEYTAVVSVDLVPRDGRWDAMRTQCHEHVRAPCDNVTANIHCISLDGVQVYAARFTDADVLPIPFRFPALEARNIAPASRLRMCRGAELLHACLMDERACLAVDADADDALTTTGTGSVVAVSCDATFWASYTPEVTAAWTVTQWRTQIMAGNLTWLTPANLRLSYGVGSPIHEGALQANLDTLAIEVGGAVTDVDAYGPAIVACTTTEAACASTGAAASACLMREYRSRTTGRFVFRTLVSRTCAPDALDDFAVLRALPVTTSQARALCGPCWNAATPPVVTSWDAYTSDPLTVDSASCACPSCAPAWNDSRACVVPTRAACSTAPSSYFSAQRLCGPSAIACTYECDAPSYAAPTCRVYGCVCAAGAIRNSDPNAPLPCRPFAVACSVAEQHTACGTYARTCTVHRDGASVTYACTGLAGADVDAATGRYDTPPYAAQPSFRMPSGLLSSGLSVGVIPDADRDPRLRGVAHWDCGWSPAYLRSFGTVSALGTARGYTGYERNITSVGGQPPTSKCAAADGTLGTGVIAMGDAGTMAMTLWDGAHNSTTYVTGRAASSRAILPSGPRAGDGAYYVALTGSPCDMAAPTYPCRAAPGVTFPLDVSGTGHPPDSTVTEGVLRFTAYDTVPRGVYHFSWAHALGLVRGASDGTPDSTFNSNASTYRVRVRDPVSVGGTVYLETLVVVNTTEWTTFGDLPSVTARGWQILVEFERPRASPDDLDACASAVAAANSVSSAAPGSWAYGWCAAAGDASADAVTCLTTQALADVLLGDSLAPCGLRSIAPPNRTTAYLERIEGTRLLLVDDLRIRREWPGDGSLSPTATWRFPGTSIRLDFTAGLRDTTGVSTRGAFFQTTDGIGGAAVGAFTVIDPTRPNANASDPLVLRLARADVGRAWLSLQDSDTLTREYTKSMWVRFGDGYTPGAYANLMSDWYTDVPGQPRNGFGVMGNQLYCGPHDTGNSIPDNDLSNVFSRPEKFRGQPATTPVGARMNVNASWAAAWHHLVCRARASTLQLPTTVCACCPQPPACYTTNTVEYTLFVDGAVLGARDLANQSSPTFSTGPVRYQMPRLVTYYGTTIFGSSVHRLGAFPWSVVGTNLQQPSHLDNLALYRRALTDVEIAALYVYDDDSDGATPQRAFPAQCLANSTVVAGDAACITAPDPVWQTAAFPIQLVFPIALNDGVGREWGPARNTTVSADTLAAALVQAYGMRAVRARAEATAAAVAGMTACLWRQATLGVDAVHFPSGGTGAGGAARGTCRWSTTPLNNTDLASDTSSGMLQYSTLTLAQTACVANPLCVGVHLDPIDEGVYSTRGAQADGVPALRGPVAGALTWIMACTRTSHTVCGLWVQPHSGTGEMDGDAATGFSILRERRKLVAPNATLAVPDPAQQQVFTVTNGQCVTLTAPAYTVVNATDVYLQQNSATHRRTASVRLTVQCESATSHSRLIVYPDCVFNAANTTVALSAFLVSGDAAPLDTGITPPACTDCDPTLPRWAIRVPVYTGCETGVCTPDTDPEDPTGVRSLFYTYIISVRCALTYTPARVSIPASSAVTRSTCGDYGVGLTLSCIQQAASVTPVCDAPNIAACQCAKFDTDAASRGLQPCASLTDRLCAPSELVALECNRRDAVPCAPGGTEGASWAISYPDIAYRNYFSEVLTTRWGITPFATNAEARMACQTTPECGSIQYTTSAYPRYNGWQLRGRGSVQFDSKLYPRNELGTVVGPFTSFVFQYEALTCADTTTRATSCRITCSGAGCTANPPTCYNQTTPTRQTCSTTDALTLCGPEFDPLDGDTCTAIGVRVGPKGAVQYDLSTILCTCPLAVPAAAQYWRARLDTIGITSRVNMSDPRAVAALRGQAGGPVDGYAWMPTDAFDTRLSCACKRATRTFVNNTGWTCPALRVPCTDVETSAGCTGANIARGEIASGFVIYTASPPSPLNISAFSTHLATAVVDTIDAAVSVRVVQTASRCQILPFAGGVDTRTCPGVTNLTLQACTAVDAQRECGDATRSCTLACAPTMMASHELAGCLLTEDRSASICSGMTLLSNYYPNGYDNGPLFPSGFGVALPTLDQALGFCVSNPSVCGAITDGSAVGYWAFLPPVCETTYFSIRGGSMIFHVDCSPTRAATAAAFLAAHPLTCRRWGDCGGPRACTAPEARILCGVAPSATAPAGTPTNATIASVTDLRVATYSSTTRDESPVLDANLHPDTLAGAQATGCAAYETQLTTGVRISGTACVWNCSDPMRYGDACRQSYRPAAPCTTEETGRYCGTPTHVQACVVDGGGSVACTCTSGYGVGALDGRGCSGLIRVCNAARGDVNTYAGLYAADCAITCQGGPFIDPATSVVVPLPTPRFVFGFEGNRDTTQAGSWIRDSTGADGLRRFSASQGAWTTDPSATTTSPVSMAIGIGGRLGQALNASDKAVWCTTVAPRASAALENFTLAFWWYQKSAPTAYGVMVAAEYLLDGSRPLFAWGATVDGAMRVTFGDPVTTNGPGCAPPAVCLPLGVWVHHALSYSVFRAFDTRYTGAWSLWPPLATTGSPCPQSDCAVVHWSDSALAVVSVGAIGAGVIPRTPAAPVARMCLCPRMGSGLASVLRKPASVDIVDTTIFPTRASAYTDCNAVPGTVLGETLTICNAARMLDDAALMCISVPRMVPSGVSAAQVAVGVCGLKITPSPAPRYLERNASVGFGVTAFLPIATDTPCVAFGGTSVGASVCAWSFGPVALTTRGDVFTALHHTGGTAACPSGAFFKYALLVFSSAAECTRVGGVPVAPSALADVAAGEALCTLVACAWTRDDDVSFGDTRAQSTLANATLYRDGVMTANTTWSASDATIPTGPTGPMCMGSRRPTLTDNNPLDAYADDLRAYSTVLTEAQIRAIIFVETDQSVPVTGIPEERCLLVNYTCRPDGVSDGSALPCSTNRQRVRIVLSNDTGTTVVSASIRLMHASGARLRGSGLRVSPQAFITVNSSNPAAVAVLSRVCGGNAIAGDVDIPLDADGALQYAYPSLTGARCECTCGWYTELAADGFSTTDPAGTGPCVKTYAGRACTNDESAAVPWDALRRTCPADSPFRCWVWCVPVPGACIGTVSTAGVSAFTKCTRLADQPCLGVTWPNAICSDSSAQTMCPRPTVSLTNPTALAWSCRGSCSFRADFGSTGGLALIQTCTSVYECSAHATTANEVLWVPPTNGGAAPVSDANRLLYSVIPCDAPPRRQPVDVCGRGAIACTQRCDPAGVSADGTTLTNAALCYSYNECTCAVNQFNALTNTTTLVQWTTNTPCDGATLTASDAVAACGPFVATANVYGCARPGVDCATQCVCLAGTGRAQDPLRISTYLPCTAYLKSCDGPLDATRSCNSTGLPGVTFFEYSTCTKACTPPAATCTSPPCWDTECVVDPASCVVSTIAKNLVPLVGPGGVRYYELDSPALRFKEDWGCQCDLNTSNRPSLDRATALTCPPTLVCVGTTPSNASTCTNPSVFGNGCCVRESVTGPPALSRVLENVRVGTAFECATGCPAPGSQLCLVHAISHIRGCPASMYVDSCYTQPALTGVCQTIDLVFQTSFTSGDRAPTCNCASGCSGCGYMRFGVWVAVNATDPLAPSIECPKRTETHGAETCARSDTCGPGTTTCTLLKPINADIVTLCANNATLRAAGSLASSPCGKVYAPEPPLEVVSCGREWFDAPGDAAVTVLHSGGVTLTALIPCSLAEARRFCGQAAVNCTTFNGIVQLSSCVCRAGADVIQPAAGQSVTGMPIPGEYCFGDGSERDCTPAEREEHCGIQGTAQCRMRAVVVNDVYATGIDRVFDIAHNGVSTCNEWRVPLQNLATVSHVRAFMNLVPGSDVGSPFLTAVDGAAVARAPAQLYPDYLQTDLTMDTVLPNGPVPVSMGKITPNKWVPWRVNQEMAPLRTGLFWTPSTTPSASTDLASNEDARITWGRMGIDVMTDPSLMSCDSSEFAAREVMSSLRRNTNGLGVEFVFPGMEVTFGTTTVKANSTDRSLAYRIAVCDHPVRYWSNYTASWKYTCTRYVREDGAGAQPINLYPRHQSPVLRVIQAADAFTLGLAWLGNAWPPVSYNTAAIGADERLRLFHLIYDGVINACSAAGADCCGWQCEHMEWDYVFGTNTARGANPCTRGLCAGRGYCTLHKPPCSVEYVPHNFTSGFDNRDYEVYTLGLKMCSGTGTSILSADEWHQRESQTAATAGNPTRATNMLHLFEYTNPDGLADWLASVIRNGVRWSVNQSPNATLEGIDALLARRRANGYADGDADARLRALRVRVAAAERVFNTGTVDAAYARTVYSDVREQFSHGPPSTVHTCVSYGSNTASVFPPDSPTLVNHYATPARMDESYIGNLFDKVTGARRTYVGTPAAGVKRSIAWLPVCTCYAGNGDETASARTATPLGVGWRDLSAYATPRDALNSIRCDDRQYTRMTRVGTIGAQATWPPFDGDAPLPSTTDASETVSDYSICPIAASGRVCSGIARCKAAALTSSGGAPPASCTAAARTRCRNDLFSYSQITDRTRRRFQSPFIQVCGAYAQPAFVAGTANWGGVSGSAQTFLQHTPVVSDTVFTTYGGVYKPCLWVPRKLCRVYPQMKPKDNPICVADTAQRARFASTLDAVGVALHKTLQCLTDSERLAVRTALNGARPGDTFPFNSASEAQSMAVTECDASEQRSPYYSRCAADGSQSLQCPMWACSVPRASDGVFMNGCPLGRGGTACELLTPVDSDWTLDTEIRVATYGIAHLGTACTMGAQHDQDSVGNELFTFHANVSGMDCSAGSTMGAFGCRNGVYNWDDVTTLKQNCICNPGWTTPKNMYTLTGSSTNGHIAGWDCTPSCGDHSTLRRPWDDHADSVKDPSRITADDRATPIASAYFMCVVPVGSVGGTQSQCSRTIPTADECINSATHRCPICSNHGDCVVGVGCRCLPGYYGRYCDLAIEDICTADSNLNGIAELPRAAPGTTARGCSGHGMCILTGIACDCGDPWIRDPDCCRLTGHCECISGRGYGWSGRNCSHPYVDVVSGTAGSVSSASPLITVPTNDCLNGGVLNADAALPTSTDLLVNHVVGHRVWCACPPAYTGLRCELSRCPVGVDGRPCSGHGTCAADRTTGVFSCRQPWDCSTTPGDARYHVNCVGKFTMMRMTCMEPGGFTAANPSGRWRGVACELDTMVYCGERNATAGVNAPWHVCNDQHLLTNAPADDAGAYTDTCYVLADNPSEFQCNCSYVSGHLGGSLCKYSACANLDAPDGANDECTGHGSACVSSTEGCKCPLDDTRTGVLTPQRGIYAHTSAQAPYCQEDVTAGCGARIRISNGAFDATGLGDSKQSASWNLFRCAVSDQGGAWRGMCARVPSTSGASTTTWRCFCDGTLSLLCADTRCLNCAAAAATGSVLVVPTPNFTEVPTLLPTALPTSTPTRAPTSPSGWTFTYAPRDASGDVPPFYTLIARADVLPVINGTRTGTLASAGDTARFTISPVLPGGLILDAFSGNISGTAIALSPVTLYAITVTFGSESAVFFIHIQVTDACGGADGGCGPHGTCVRTSGSAGAVCACTGLWTGTDASDPRSPCLNHTCASPSVPDDAGGAPQRCVCPGDRTLTVASGCFDSGCLLDQDTGALCGPTMACQSASFGTLNTTAVPGKRCTVTYSGANATVPTYTCQCSDAYAFSGATGRCTPICDPLATTNVVVHTPGVSTGAIDTTVTCLCTPGGASPLDAASGCRRRWCQHGGVYNRSVSTTRCVCAAPFDGTRCTDPATGVTSNGAQCECISCGPFGALSCTLADRDASTCLVGGGAPTCTCAGLAYGARCDQSPCNAALGSALDPTNATLCLCGGGDPLHAYGGTFCNISRCNGAPVVESPPGVFRCQCSAGAYASASSAFCAGGCLTNAEQLSADVPCTCAVPFTKMPGCATACGVDPTLGSTGGPVTCGCAWPFNASGCGLTCNPAYAALVPSRAARAGGRQCVCVRPEWWRGLYCNVSACGPMGVPVPDPVAPSTPPLRIPVCRCDSRAEDKEAARKTGLYVGCQPKASFACNGGTFDQVTGACVCATGCTGYPFCDMCSGAVGPGAPDANGNITTNGPTVVPTAVPSMSPTSAAGSPTRAPTRQPTAIPTRQPTSAPTQTTGNATTVSPSPGPITCEVNPAGACVSGGGGGTALPSGPNNPSVGFNDSGTDGPPKTISGSSRATVSRWMWALVSVFSMAFM